MARINVEDWLTEDSLKKLELYKRRGYTDEQVAKQIGIAIRTFYDWKKKNPPIMQALKKGKQTGIDLVETTMFDKAIGYTDDEDNYHPPETTAGIFILKSMRPNLYSDKQLNDLDKQKLEQEIEKLKLDNELKKRILSGDEEADKLSQLIQAVDNATIIDAENISQ